MPGGASLRRGSGGSMSLPAHFATEEGRDSVRRCVLVTARLLRSVRTTITAEPGAAHRLRREREDVPANSGSRSVGCPVAMARSQAWTRRSLVRSSMNTAPEISPMGNW